MSAGPGHPSLRAGIAAALAEVISAHSNRAIAEQIGVVGTTISRRGEDLAQWPTTDLLALAVSHDDLSRAIITYLTGDDHEPGQAVSLVSDMYGLVGECGRLLTEASQALADGMVTIDEAKRLLAIIRAVQAKLLLVEADLRVVVR